jgi:hypothetical protein
MTPPHEHAKRALAGQYLLLNALLWEEESNGLLPDDLYQWARQAWNGLQYLIPLVYGPPFSHQLSLLCNACAMQYAEVEVEVEDGSGLRELCATCKAKEEAESARASANEENAA